MRVSFDLDGTLFGIHSKKLVNMYRAYMSTSNEVGILTGRASGYRAESQELLRSIGITSWDFWYDSEYMNPREIALLGNANVMAMKPYEREVIHRWKARMIADYGIDRHYDDEARWMLVMYPNLPVIDVTVWGGEPGVNIVGD